MPRRNRRDHLQSAAPLDLTPPPVQREWPPPLRPGQRVLTRAERDNEQAERQRKARMQGGIDWQICMVPGCGEKLQFCQAGCAWAARTLVTLNRTSPWLARQQAEEDARHEAKKKQRAASIDGWIYFVRLNGLIKAGWTRDLRERLRAYGPEVEVLAHHEATRDDETYMHRNLRPFLARGREWYEDCPAVQAYVADTVKRYGPPHVAAYWTQPKPPTIKLHNRSA